jgi:dynein heavy chain, axonemal
MVYLDSTHLTWNALIKSWLNTINEEKLDTELKAYVENLFEKYFEHILIFSRKKCAYIQFQVEISKIDMLCTILKSLLYQIYNMNLMEDADIKAYICKLWLWATLWSVGSNCFEASRILLERFMRNLLAEHENIDLPDGSLWEYRINPESKIWEKWEKIIPPFLYNPSMQFFDMIVPTSDTVRFGYISEILLKAGHPVMFMGEVGVGKTVIAKEILSRLSAQGDVIPVFINFSAQTNSIRTQEMIENRLEKRKKTLLGAPIGKKCVIFIDDVNMPKLEVYGAQPPIELLRQFLDFKGLYDRDKMYWKDIVDLILAAACGPPGGARNPITPRFLRHFSLLSFPTLNTNTLISIFGGIIVGFFADFAKTIWSLAEPIVLAAVNLYERISQELLPTPTKSHYLFNLRDLSKCIQGILQADTSTYTNQMQILRLFYHEALRTFHDRLVTQDDKSYFKKLLNEICKQYFDCRIVDDDETLMFGDFMVFGQARENRVYEEIKEMDKLKSILNDYLQDYNAATGSDMKLILFQDAIEHILRLARLLRAERGNGLLVGLSGMGKQSITRLASNINGYQCMQIELKPGYDYTSFREDLRKFYLIAGINNSPIVFLINDSQIQREEFLEDINNVLNSGDVPNLFEAEEYEKLILSARVPCIEANYKDQSRDGIYEFFISRVRTNLHVVLCMSPVGDAFRKRCRMFPSLVNCCTIDWFVKWPREALYSVAMGSLKSIANTQEECENMASVCVTIHESVENASDQFYREAKRHYYTTPSSYLELLKQYHVLMAKRINSITSLRDKIANGLNKILETNEVVASMGEELKVIVPIMEQKSTEMKETVARLEKDTAQADIIKKVVMQDEVNAKAKAIETQELADDAAKDLEAVMPQLRYESDFKIRI